MRRNIIYVVYGTNDYTIWTLAFCETKKAAYKEMRRRKLDAYNLWMLERRTYGRNKEFHGKFLNTAKYKPDLEESFFIKKEILLR